MNKDLQKILDEGKNLSREEFAKFVIRKCASWAHGYTQDTNALVDHYGTNGWEALPEDLRFCMLVQLGAEELK